ncbi:hypothetical protein AVEN_160445-1 [Araneus ventricosus]|uniref:Uncharacterized protein n=1 Tax=Araneus ventricosus TaxID=182803 RepID=A0A4Y2N5V4_ARAVE|nr:hypothetical protein AVEN_160445-1 [Araneus ventricosus]
MNSNKRRYKQLNVEKLSSQQGVRTVHNPRPPTRPQERTGNKMFACEYYTNQAIRASGSEDSGFQIRFHAFSQCRKQVQYNPDFFFFPKTTSYGQECQITLVAENYYAFCDKLH